MSWVGGIFAGVICFFTFLFFLAFNSSRRLTQQLDEISQEVERQRVKDVMAAAPRLNMQYSADAEPQLLDHLIESFGQFGHGVLTNRSNRRPGVHIHNLLEAEMGDCKVALCEHAGLHFERRLFQYEQTVLLIESPTLVLPPQLSVLSHPDWSDPFGVSFDFPAYPAFDKKYFVECPDEPAARRLLNNQVIRFLEQLSDFCIEGHHNQLMIYPSVADYRGIDMRSRGETGTVADHRVPVDELGEFLETGLAIFRTLHKAAQEMSDK